MEPSGYVSNFNVKGNTVAISEGGNSCGFVHYIQSNFWCGGHCYSLYSNEINNVFLYYALKASQDKIMALRVGSGLPNIQKSSLEAYEFLITPELGEQIAIARVLYDMDAEISALETRLAKMRAIKQGMMQDLLTGRVRLPLPSESPALEDAHGQAPA